MNQEFKEFLKIEQNNHFNRLLSLCKTSKDIQDVVFLNMQLGGFLEMPGLSSRYKSIRICSSYIYHYPTITNGSIIGWNGSLDVKFETHHPSDFKPFLSLLNTNLKFNLDSYKYYKPDGRKNLYHSTAHYWLDAQHCPLMKDLDEKKILWKELSNGKLEFA